MRVSDALRKTQTRIRVFEVQPIPVKLRCSSSGTDPIVAKPIIPARTVVISEMITIMLAFLFRPATYPIMIGATNMKNTRPVKVGNSSPRKVKTNHKATAVKIPVASLNLVYPSQHFLSVILIDDFSLNY